MLRTIGMKNARPRLEAFTCTNSGSAVTASVGDALGTYADGGTGINELTLTKAFRRAPVVISSPGGDVADGGFVKVDTAPTTSVVELTSANSSGTADDGTTHAIMVGFDSVLAQKTVGHPVVNSRDRGRLLAFQVDGTGTASITIGGKHATLVDNGTGDYTLTFSRNFQSTPVAVGCVDGATAGLVQIYAISKTSVQIKTFNTAGSPTDYDFMLFVQGWDSKDEQRNRRVAVKTPSFRPRLEAFYITYSAGTPSIVTGTSKATLTDNDTGDLTITLNEAFRRTPVVVASGDPRACNVDNVATTGADILAFNTSGTATDPDGVHVIMLGYDFATEQ